MGWGTGLIGKYLSEKGYKNIDGVDLSNEMLDIAKEKGIYSNLGELHKILIFNFQLIFYVVLGNPSTFPDKYRDKYGAVACSAVMYYDYVGPEIFDEMLLALKQGGLAVFTARAHFVKDFCTSRINELVDTGKWECIKMEEFDRYDKVCETIEGFKPTTSMVWVQYFINKLDFRMLNLNFISIIFEKCFYEK